MREAYGAWTSAFDSSGVGLIVPTALGNCPYEALYCLYMTTEEQRFEAPLIHVHR